jgi:hypothetical protein
MAERTYTPAEIAKFKRAAKALAELGRAGGYLYLANDTLHLMSGPSHDGSGWNSSARQDRVVASVTIPRMGGGDW